MTLRRRLTRTILAVSLALAGCSRPPLPEAGTPAAQLYTTRCGTCHPPYNPHVLTAAMWQVQVEAMRAKIVAAGQPPLTYADQAAILAYLRRNAGTQ